MFAFFSTRSPPVPLMRAAAAKPYVSIDFYILMN